jgi:hypothetical protein
LDTKTSNGAEISADTFYSLGTLSNATLTANDVIEFTVSTNGAATDLSSAQAMIFVAYE